ncbi:type III secretion system inner membrane ring subunit SctD [Bordetella genomosp. 13]|uniref:type III secretion system inner membrane ring subunit SctD n=1 Tax=Bordetella genomosp. 13 TaxID=463040 RepID=UPI00119D2FDE|nr:type III secretion system inner membrane ring subunit SctD [Bordetella genomosp. 13]
MSPQGHAKAAPSPDVLELRVLSGLHREASCVAEDGALLGADPACDVVLADEGLGAQAARLRIGANGWDLAPGQGAPAGAAEPATPFNQPMPLGPVWVTVARRSDPWAAQPVAANDGDASGAALIGVSVAAAAAAGAPADGDPADGAQAGASAAGPASTGSTGSAAADGRPAIPALPRPRKRDNWPLVLGLAAVVLTIVVAICMAWLLPSTPRKALERPDPRQAAERSIGQITAALERLGLASRLHVAMSRDGTVLVSGWVRNAAEQDRVASALSQIWPMPAMRVSAEDAAVNSATATLKAFGVRYAARYDGDGRMTILGIAASARERASALDAVRAQLPGMTVLGNDIALAPDVADALAARLAEAGLSGIALAWKSDRLEAGAGGLDDEQLAQLQDVVARFNATHLDVVALARPAAASRQFADSVPFGIRSVVGGPQPFVVLEDGSKLLVGGTYRQYRLTAVEPRRLVFDGPRPAIVLR